MRYLFRSWTGSEKLNAALSVMGIIGFVLAAVTPFFGEASDAVLWVFGVSGAACGLWFLFSFTRPAFQISGYGNVMAFLEQLALTSRRRVWTARTHVGTGVREKDYFKVIRGRLTDTRAPLEDFRRVFRMVPSAASHLEWLVENFACEEAVEVRGFDGNGAQFDFMIVDGKVAVIGFPMEGGSGNVGAIALRRIDAVRGVESVFNSLWNESDLIFKGATGNKIECLKDRALEMLQSSQPKQDVPSGQDAA